MNITETFKLIGCASIASMVTVVLMNQTNDTLRAKRIEIIGANGKPSIQLDGTSASIKAFDERGKEFFTVGQFGGSFILLESGQDSILLAASSKETFFSIKGKNGEIGLSSRDAVK